MASPAFALLNDESINQDQSVGVNNENDNTNTGINTNITSSDSTSQARQQQDQDQDQAQLQGQDQEMQQGQIGINKQAMGQGQQAEIDIQDNRETTGYYLAAPSTIAASGQKASSIYSIFGGLNLAQTEEAKHCMDVLNVIGQLETAEYLTAEQARAEALKVFEQLKDATASKRLLGVLWKTRGNHLLNGLGLFAWDDLYAKMGGGEKHERVDTNLDIGNRGNF